MFISIPLIAVSSLLFVSTQTYTSETAAARTVHTSSHQTGTTVYQKSSAQTGENGSASVHITTIVNGEKVVDIHKTSTGTPITIESVYPATGSVARVHVTADSASSTHPVTSEALLHAWKQSRLAPADPPLQHVPVPLARSIHFTNIITELEDSEDSFVRHARSPALWTHFTISHAQTIAYALSLFPL